MIPSILLRKKNKQTLRHAKKQELMTNYQKVIVTETRTRGDQILKLSDRDVKM